LSYNGSIDTQISLYEDSHRNYLIDSYPVVPGQELLLDVRQLARDKVYLEIGQDHATVELIGDKAVATGDIILNCLVLKTFLTPLGPPHYFDLTLKYVGTKNPISLTAYNGSWDEILGSYAVDSISAPVFTINGSYLPEGHLGENLVLEYAPIE
jgi:hypothetical protein